MKRIALTRAPDDQIWTQACHRVDLAPQRAPTPTMHRVDSDGFDSIRTGPLRHASEGGLRAWFPMLG